MARKQTDRNSEPETLWTKLFGHERNEQPIQIISKDDQETVRRYLLGHLTAERQQEVEQRLLTEDAFFEELEIGEDELIEEYLAGGLHDTEREGFEHYFLATPERQQNVRFAEVLRRYSPQRQIYWWNNQTYLRAAATVAIVIMLAGVLWFLRYRAAPTPTIATLTLTISNSDRAEGPQAAKTKREVDELRIVLLLPERSTPAPRYRVELMTEMRETRILKVVKQDARSVSVVIPAAQLSRGQAAIRLFAISSDGSEQRISGSYLFTVE